ncbi:ATP synthase F1 subunit gamma [Candidatus Dojkabacteria bacterium]|uniref:ATP synthase gamma chain n=1 Tax=Candidatus Dojkabacteria bacterium TaxID=2099670 RepID=A0A955L9P7_9BACT|nr:ATP synthase F1 subunit gamma [Candidatus Dojkabacteria bacterium]
MVNTKEIKKRINSVKNTKKITKAMEMIAAVKMRKAIQAAVNTRDYSALANNLMDNLSGKKIDHPLARNKSIEEFDNSFENQVKSDKPEFTGKHLLIVITSNRGLCGSYNAKIIKKAYEFISKEKKTEEVFDVLAIGSKAALFAKRNKLNLISLFDSIGDTPTYDELLPVSNLVQEKFLNGTYDKVTLFFTNYISGLSQEVIQRQLLPISRESIIESFEQVGDERTKKDHNKNKFDSIEISEYEYEPNKKRVLNYLLPMLVEVLIYQAVLESSASEHSSRMMAMKNASDSASEMIDNLTLEFNKGRQAAITQEISEIVGGAVALE